MKGLKKFGAIICAIAMIVSSITYYPTSNVSAATALPKKVIGLVANSKSGSDTIENAIMFAWAGADDPANVAGYDPTVTSTVIYIYKDGKQVTKIGNATKGGVVGGLPAGSYTAQAANVNMDATSSAVNKSFLVFFIKVTPFDKNKIYQLY